MSENQERLLELIKKKKECDKKALEIVHKLIEPQVDQDFLINNAVYIGRQHFDDIIEERRLIGNCGWAVCFNQLDSNVSGAKQKYIIRGQRVLDITQRKSYCSSKCFAKSTHFRKQLLVSPLWLRDEDEEALDSSFEILEEDVQLHGLRVNITGLTLDDEEDDEEDKKEKKTGELSSSSDDEDETIVE